MTPGRGSAAENASRRSLLLNHQYRVCAAEIIGRAFLGVRVTDPLAIDDEPVFVSSRAKGQGYFPRRPAPVLLQRSPLLIPVVETAGHAHRTGVGLRKDQVNRFFRFVF